MKRLLIGAVAVGSMLFAATGVATANTATPQTKPTAISLAKPATKFKATIAGGCTSTATGPASVTCVQDVWYPAGHVTAGPDGQASWPLAAQPGSVTVAFDTPAIGEHISGYAVTCTAPQTPVALPPLVATFVLNPADMSSLDAGLTHPTVTTTSLHVGEYQLLFPASYHAAVAGVSGPSVDNQLLPTLACKVVASNAAGVSVTAGAAAPPVATAASGDCASVPDDAALAFGGGVGELSKLGGGDLRTIEDHIGTPTLSIVTTSLTSLKQTNSNTEAILVDTSSVGGPASPIPFCVTSPSYAPQLDANQALTVTPTVSTTAPTVLDATQMSNFLPAPTAASARTVTSVSTTTVATTAKSITTTTPQFSATDVGAPISGSAIPAGAYISAFVTTSKVSISLAATSAGVSSVTITPGCLSLVVGPAKPNQCVANAVPAATRHFRSWVTVAGLGIKAPVKSSLTLAVGAFAATVFAFDDFHFTVVPSSCSGVPSAAVLCSVSHKVASASGPAHGEITVVEMMPHTIAPLGSVVSTPVSPIFERQRTNFITIAAPGCVSTATGPLSASCVGSNVVGLGLAFGGSQLGITVNAGTPGAIGPLPLTVAPAGAVVSAIKASYVSIPLYVNPASTGCPDPATYVPGSCVPYTALPGFQETPSYIAPLTGGDKNLGAALAFAPTAGNPFGLPDFFPTF